MISRPSKDIVEAFGYAPDDLTPQARTLWDLGACPFVNKGCSKTNSDKTIVYGTCSVTTPYGDCIICPNRIYADNYATLKKVAIDAFDGDFEFLTFDEFIPKRNDHGNFVVALGHNSGREVSLGQKMSMDWVLANICNGKLQAYVGIEVQSIDITGNYRDNWYAYKNLSDASNIIPKSEHGLNWANVHKRLIPQLIRKGLIYGKSDLVPKGLYFIVPEIVYKKFEDVIGADIPLKENSSGSTITVHTYSLSSAVQHGAQRSLVLERELHFELNEFSNRFISGARLPSGDELDNAVKKVLGL
ncbi:TPA: restriction endonuclease [Vibrio vulnificus]|nr:hypothetical protein [Vibrio vulnificus]HAS8429721.1 restriction endonuclease [Vibrio vulnificus]